MSKKLLVDYIPFEVTPEQIQHFWEKYYRHPYAV